MEVRLPATCLGRLHRHGRVRPQGRPLGIRVVVSSISSRAMASLLRRILRNRADMADTHQPRLDHLVVMVDLDTADTVNSLLLRVVVNGVRVRRRLGRVMVVVPGTEDSPLMGIRGRRPDSSRRVGISFLVGIIGGRNGCAGN
jgi:hypothetical protein